MIGRNRLRAEVAAVVGKGLKLTRGGPSQNLPGASISASKPTFVS